MDINLKAFEKLFYQTCDLVLLVAWKSITVTYRMSCIAKAHGKNVKPSKRFRSVLWKYHGYKKESGGGEILLRTEFNFE